MLGLFQAVKGALWLSNSNESLQQKDEPTKKTETTTLTGRVTQYDKAKRSGMVNHSIYFDNDVIIGGETPQVGSEVNVHAERDHSLAGWKATKVTIISQLKASLASDVVNKVGYILDEGRTSCLVLCGEIEYVFGREIISNGYYLRCGDWVTLKLINEDGNEFVNSVNTLREKTVTATIESYGGQYGMIEGDTGFTRYVCEGGYSPREGDTVLVHCVECKHNKMSWRALSVSRNRDIAEPISVNDVQLLSNSTNSVVKCGVYVTGDSDFGEVECDKPTNHVMVISNKCTSPHTLLSCYPVSMKDCLTITIDNGNYGAESTDGMDNGNYGAESTDGMDNGNYGAESTDEARHDSYTIPTDTDVRVNIKLTSSVLGVLATALVFDFGEFRITRSVRARVIDEAIYMMQPTRPYTRHFNNHSSYNYAQYSDKLRAVTTPGQKPIRKKNVRLPYKLKLYPIPDDIRECFDLEEDVTFVRPSILEPLSLKTHKEVFSALLCCEELQIEKNIRVFDMYCVTLVPSRQYLSLNVPGLSEGRPSILVGDKVIICEAGGDERSQHHEGYIHEVRGSDILLMFSERFHDRFRGDEDYDVMFTFNRMPLRRMHQAVEMATQIGSKVLFPIQPSPLAPLLRLTSPTTFFNSQLNDRQQAAVCRILGSQGRPSPYIIFGPPGTGKTVTVVEAILQVYIQSGGRERILACTPSNSAADLIAERLIDSGKLEKGDLVRMNALQRVQPPSPRLLPHCIDTDEIELASRHKIIVSTCVSAGVFYSLGLPVGHFSRVFVDEVGQATEPECMIPLGLLAGTDGQPVLVGDPFQLGPVLQSRLVQSHGLGLSLLERLMNRPAYQRDEEKYIDHGAYDPLLVTKLVANYRSHQSLLSLYSEIFYDDELQPAADPSLTHTLCQWHRLPCPGFPLLFHGMMGEDIREGDSPSWFNPIEVVQVVRYTQLLLGGTQPLSVDDIGIITPYRKQVEKIRMFLKTTGIENVKVGSVEEFQGQERSAIILSTVRCNSNVLAADLQHNLGFLSNPKRFNVSISRAQALLIVVGNPVLLNQDEYWSKLLNYAIENSAYVGTPLNRSNLVGDD